MIRLLVGSVLCSILALPALGHDGPVCGRPEVLRVVSNMIAAQGSVERVVINAVSEVPTTNLSTVLCSVRLFGQFYDARYPGAQPLYSQRVYEFTVRRGRNALFVEAVAQG